MEKLNDIERLQFKSALQWIDFQINPTLNEVQITMYQEGSMNWICRWLNRAKVEQLRDWLNEALGEGGES